MKQPRYKDIAGLTFHRLTAVRFDHVDERRRANWLFRCVCGTEVVAPATMVRYGHNKSCGCMLRENQARGTLRHGRSQSACWKAWLRMRKRCEQPSSQRYPNYGGRGITVCERWSVFENFYADMGDPPPGYTLERRDVNASYSPENCLWIEPADQYRNKTNTLRVSLHGVEVAFCDLVSLSGLNYATAYARLKSYGWPVERVFPSITPADVRRLTEL